jgi:hypothetical protein
MARMSNPKSQVPAINHHHQNNMNTTTTTNNKYNTGCVTMAHEMSSNGASENPIDSIVNTQFLSIPKETLFHVETRYFFQKQVLMNQRQRNTRKRQNLQHNQNARQVRWVQCICLFQTMTAIYGIQFALL